MIPTFGPVLHAKGTTFHLWAPLHQQMGLQVAGHRPCDMRRSQDGWFTADLPGVQAGALYHFALPNGAEVPDPASRFQPRDVHGPSEVVDLCAYQWHCTDWPGRPWEEIVLYELHLGAFTSEGSFASAAHRLDHLQDLGVTAVQIMPIGDFAGLRNWGYDGVLPYAPDATYGHPHDLMAFVDAAHQRGICVFLDVVYNHFGPEGNYIPSYAPLFTRHHQTPWGDAVNFDGFGAREVREFIIQNAIYWIREFKIDGLRLDAVHAIKDDSDQHLLHELARRVRAAAPGRHVHLIVENEDNDSALLARDKAGEPLDFTAQWNDDVHHVLHIAATGESFGYYADYADDAAKLGRALAEGFAFQGETMPYSGKRRGKPSAQLPPWAFVAFIQNHDQIGNRALGDRMITYTGPEKLKAIAAICLLLPQIPMLFMGEEWGAREPFPYFCDFNDDLNEIVRKGRRKELCRLPGFEENDEIDPTAPSAFLSAKLDWSRLQSNEGLQWLDFYRHLLGIRRERILPFLGAAGVAAGKSRRDGPVITVHWKTPAGTALLLEANLSDRPGHRPPSHDRRETILALGALPGRPLPPWSVLWSVVPAQAWQPTT